MLRAKVYTLLFLACLYTFPVYAQKPETEVYELISAFLLTKKEVFPLSLSFLPYSGEHQNLSHFLEHSYHEHVLKTVGYKKGMFFSEIDLSFFKDKIASSSTSVLLDSGLLMQKGVKILRPVDEASQKDKANERFVKITQPLISKDGTKAILYIQRFCGDGGCASGDLYLFEKDVKKNWKIISRLAVFQE